ncbi:hypothetical protein V6C03_00520 [Methyloligella sp. 2.7D]|uniref:hypothetical protein n=1 Tax=unclassified Methyloligella TaxID=2625955 RepID=UPI00157DE834|nr:hypothetical protein [Methyloligella sp. GL2]QKP76844.1 hypothetical protein HT051_04895 [Methyloligella sp. GL2]
MLKKLMIGLASAAVLTGAAATPALAVIPHCMEAPNPDTCPYGGAPTVTQKQTHLFDRFYQRHHQAPAEQS